MNAAAGNAPAIRARICEGHGFLGVHLDENRNAVGEPHKQDIREAHDEPLGAQQVRLAKETYGWDPDAQFYIPDGVTAHFDEQVGRRGATARAVWGKLFAAYRQQIARHAVRRTRGAQRQRQ